MKLNNLYQIQKKDLEKSAVTLAKAFNEYPLFKYILGDKHNQKNLKIINRFLTKYSILYGKAYASSSNLEGVVLFSDIKDYNFSFFRSLRAGALSLFKLGLKAGKRFKEYDEFSEEIQQSVIKKPHLYLMMLGVGPDYQRQGHGKKLLQAVLNKAKEKKQSCFLETHAKENVAIYKNYGFRLVRKDKVPNSNLIQYSMLKK